MSKIKVNTAGVLAAADKLEILNNDMREDFSKLESAMKKLDNSWEGAAAANAIAKFNSLKKSLPETRHRVMENYIRFMRQQVGEGYTLTEEANTSLADAFK